MPAAERLAAPLPRSPGKERPLRFAGLGLLVIVAAAILAPGCGSKRTSSTLDPLLAQGWQAYSTGDFDFAAECFRGVQTTQRATADQTYSAILGLATVYHLQSNPDFGKAREYYALLAGLNTENARKQSALGLARVDVAEGKDADGRSKLAAVMRDYPDSTEADEAVVHLAESLFAPRADEAKPGGFGIAGDASMERGLKLLEDRLSARPRNPLASAMHMMLANKYIELKRFDKALENLLAAEKDGIAVDRLRSVVVWRVARIAEQQLKDYALAERYYQRYVDDFGRTVLYYRALTSLERVRALMGKEGAQQGKAEPSKGT